MKNFTAACKALYRTLINQLREIDNAEPECNERICAAITICGDYIQQLRALVVKHDFADTEQQIHFFKHIKPAFTCEAIYYANLFNLQLKWPVGSVETQKEYLIEAAQKITRFYHEHQSFYEYHRAELTHLDAQYFVRGRPDYRIYTDHQLLFADPVFCTPCDQKLATLLAYERLQVYIQQKQQCLLQGVPLVKNNLPVIPFTGTNAEAVELMYALKKSGRFNNGKTTIAEFTRFFEVHFKVVVVDPYKTLGEMRMRKGSHTKFIDYMRDELSKFMDQDDDQ